MQLSLKKTIRLISHAVALMSVLAAASCASPQDAPPEKLKTLVVDGFSNHDWRKTTAFIRTTLSDTGMFEVAVSTSPGNADSMLVGRPNAFLPERAMAQATARAKTRSSFDSTTIRLRAALRSDG